MQYGLVTYGWRGTLVILSGLSLQSIPCAAVLKQPKTTRMEERDLLLSRNVDSPQESHDSESISLSPLPWLRDIGKILGISLLSRSPFIAQVVVPAFVWGYTFSGWVIYIVTFVLSNDLSTKDSSIVASCGGFGILIIKLLLPILHRIISYRNLLYISSLILALSFVLYTIFTTYLHMCIISVVFGIGNGIVGAETYIAAKEVTDEHEQLYAVAWSHLSFGLASFLTGFVTGKSTFICIENDTMIQLEKQRQMLLDSLS